MHGQPNLKNNFHFTFTVSVVMQIHLMGIQLFLYVRKTGLTDGRTDVKNLSVFTASVCKRA
jgi:hypothetical protein